MVALTKRGLILVSVLTCIGSWFHTGIAHAQESAVQETIDLDLNNVSLRHALQLLCNQLNKNLLMDATVPQTTLQMDFKAITPLNAFAALLEANGLGFKELEGNVYFVAPAEKVGHQLAVRHLECRYADAKELVEILSSMITAETGAVLADERTNTLIIKESPSVILKIEKLVRTLDRPTQQVYIQAEIVEVSTTNDHQLGVEWLWKTANFKTLQGRIGTDFELQPEEETATTSTQGEGTAPTVSLPFPGGQGLGVGILNGDVDVVLHALDKKNRVNLLSRPRIVTMDNQESIIEVGDQIPFKRLNEFGVTSFEFKNATVQLLVKPHVIDNKYILLEVSPKADFQNGFTPDGIPIISTRKASTNVKVKDGQTIVIGGLIRDSEIQTESRIPILGSIPLIGTLFKNKISTKTKTELIVFIKPIILNEEDSSDLFELDFKMRKSLELQSE